MPHRKFRQHRPLYTNTLPPAVSEPKMKWKILPIFWLGIKRTATVLGFMVLLNLVLALIILPAFLPQQASSPSLPEEMVLFLKFEGGVRELPAPVSLTDPFAERQATVKDIVEGLDRAAADSRVKGIVARMYNGSFALSHVTEIRAALKRFRDTGKFAHIYSSSYGDGGGGLGRYYLASAFDEIWMQPLGVVSITGVGVEVPFFRETLDKIGVEPQFFKRKDYKTAYESLTDKSISPENKETMQKIVWDIRNEMLTKIPEDRGMNASAFEKLVNKGVFTAPEAEAAGLITYANYGDVLLDNIAEAVTGVRDPDELELINMGDYIGARRGEVSKFKRSADDKIALVYAVGAIMPTGEGGGFSDDGIAAADEIAPAILAASKEEDVSAIVLRIDSPGGSPSASESILRAVEKAQERGKPVIVSMGATAASGGYWIAAYADKIYALPTTLTGSIGVVGGKFAMKDLFSKLGVNWDKVSWGRNAGIWSPNTPFNASESERINAMLDNIYENFVARVAKGRKMSVEAVDKVAGGRVWTGRRAVDVGLVDELGGLENALDHVASLTGVESRNDLNIVVYPKPKTAFEQVLELLDTQATMGKSVKVQERVLKAAGPMLDLLQVYENPQNYSTYEPLSLQ